MLRLALTLARSAGASTSSQSIAETCMRALTCTQLTSAPLCGCRHFSDLPDPDPEVNPQPTQTVLDVVDRIENLTVKELVWLNKLLKERLGIDDSVMGMPMGGPAAMPAGGAPAPAAETAAAPPAQEKTEFNVIIEGYEASDKIKIIKEVRSVIPGLGLKDAKDLVDKIPASIQTGLAKADADELKKKLEAVGARVKLD